MEEIQTIVIQGFSLTGKGRKPIVEPENFWRNRKKINLQIFYNGSLVKYYFKKTTNEIKIILEREIIGKWQSLPLYFGFTISTIKADEIIKRLKTNDLEIKALVKNSGKILIVDKSKIIIIRKN
ncbi:MAG: hypothetical protein ABIG10_04165 [bacterium]